MLLRLWSNHPYRATHDLDLLRRGDGSFEAVRGDLRMICTAPADPDGILYDADSIRIEAIRAEDEYAGTRATLQARCASARLSLQIDLGIGDPELGEAKHREGVAGPDGRCLLRIRVEVPAVVDDPIVKKLGLVDQLGLQLGESSRQIHAHMTERQDVDLPGDDVTYQYVLSHGIEAQPEGIVRALLEQRRELGKAPEGAVEVVEVSLRDVPSPTLDRVGVDLVDVEDGALG